MPRKQVVDASDGITKAELNAAGRILRVGVTVPCPLPVNVHKHSYGTAVVCPLCGQRVTALLIDVRTNYIGCEVCYQLPSSLDESEQALVDQSEH